ncbi:hypothetical protein BWI93_10325 [Siphonobacter sp. BAB-5385]|nr:hypothetical protein BWI93_10325 [Siphonobacter sp. BAB-5385]
MASLVKLNAQLHLAQLAFSKNPSEGNQAKIDELLAQISELSVIADDSKQSNQRPGYTYDESTGQWILDQTGSTEVKKRRGKHPPNLRLPRHRHPPNRKNQQSPKHRRNQRHQPRSSQHKRLQHRRPIKGS